MNRNFHISDSLPAMFINPLSKVLDPNTYEGSLATKRVLDFDRINEKWVNETCGKSSVIFSDRKADKKSKNAYKMIVDVAGWNKFMSKRPKCLIIIGYFLNTQWYNPFLPQIKSTLRSFSERLPHLQLHPQSLVIHMRCAEPHYMSLPKEYYEIILNSTTWSDLYIAASPSCKRRKTYKHVRQVYGARHYQPTEKDKKQAGEVWEGYTAFLLDFSLLISAPRLVLCPSTFSDWAGIMSQASIIHTIHYIKKVGYTVSRNWAPLWSADDRYVYHDPYAKRWFGSFDSKSRTVIFKNSTAIPSSTDNKNNSISR